MDAILAAITANSDVILMILLVLVVVVVTLVHYAQASAGRTVRRRALPAFQVLRGALGRASETGRAIHVSPGAGTIGNRATTAETVVGLLAAERVVTEAARSGAPVLVSSGDAVSHLALRGTLRQAYQNAGQAQDYDPNSVQLLAHQDSTAYSVGVMTLYGRQHLEASQLIGSFNQDFLLIGEDGAQRNIPQIAGATSTSALPVMLLSTPYTLIGEEIFVAEAYLSDNPVSDARLRTHDILRVIVIILILLGFVYALLLQPLLNLPALPVV
jgi:hypothetical protein